MSINIRTPTEQDWAAILRAANASLPWQAKGNEEWLENRKKFDEIAHQRRHYAAEDAASREVVGYGSIEGGNTPGKYRVFVVTDARLLPTVGEVLYHRLFEELRLLGGQVAWVREEARDGNLLEFFRRHGFVDEQRFTTEQGLQIVTLQQNLTGSDGRV